MNVSENCLDRHLKEHPLKPAIIWEGDHPSRHKIISFVELHDEVCRFANVLKKQGVGKGDRVILYMPMIPEAAIAMLACTRVGGALRSIWWFLIPWQVVLKTVRQNWSLLPIKACVVEKLFP